MHPPESGALADEVSFQLQLAGGAHFERAISDVCDRQLRDQAISVDLELNWLLIGPIELEFAAPAPQIELSDFDVCSHRRPIDQFSDVSQLLALNRQLLCPLRRSSVQPLLYRRLQGKISEKPSNPAHIGPKSQPAEHRIVACERRSNGNLQFDGITFSNDFFEIGYSL